MSLIDLQIMNTRVMLTQSRQLMDLFDLGMPPERCWLFVCAESRAVAAASH